MSTSQPKRGTGILGSPSKPAITNMSGVKRPSRLKLFIYGPPGVGKTWLAGGAPKPLLFDFDGGAASLAGRDVDVVDRPSTDDFQGHVHWLLQEGGAGYETVIIDTLTAAQKQTTVEVMGGASRMSQQLWGETLTIWRKLLIALEGLPCNLLILAHEKEENMGDEDHAVKRYTYALQGSIVSDIHAMFDSIGRMTKHIVRKSSAGQPLPTPVEVRRLRFFAPAEDFLCKDRLELFGKAPVVADISVLEKLAHEKSGSPTPADATALPPKPAAPAPVPTPPAATHPKSSPTPPPTPPAVPKPPSPPPAAGAETVPEPPPQTATPPRRRKRAPQEPQAPQALPRPPEPVEEAPPLPDDSDAPPQDKDDTSQPPEGDDFPWENATTGGTP